ncbi:MAG: ornithine cyclodeaminase family protein [Gaiellales bacterium]
MTRLLSDADVRRLLTPQMAVEGARQALVDAHQGRLAAPPRVRADVGDGQVVFTVGGYAGGVSGFRAYQLVDHPSDQVVVVWAADGSLLGCVAGTQLGAMRTGALGAVAVDALAVADVEHAGVVGSGRQAWAQVWALSAVRAPHEVRIHSPTEQHRVRFAERARGELGLNAIPVGSARDAVSGAAVIIVSTVSPQPVIETGWVEPGAHVNSVGPKGASAHEIPRDLADRADVFVSDSPAQAAAYTDGFFTSRDLVHLGTVLCGDAPGRAGRGDITLYASTGLAGSEVVIAQRVLEAG